MGGVGADSRRDRRRRFRAYPSSGRHPRRSRSAEAPGRAGDDAAETWTCVPPGGPRAKVTDEGRRTCRTSFRRKQTRTARLRKRPTASREGEGVVFSYRRPRASTTRPRARRRRARDAPKASGSLRELLSVRTRVLAQRWCVRYIEHRLVSRHYSFRLASFRLDSPSPPACAPRRVSPRGEPPASAGSPRFRLRRPRHSEWVSPSRASPRPPVRSRTCRRRRVTSRPSSRRAPASRA